MAIVSTGCWIFISPSSFFYDFFRGFRLLWNRHDPNEWQLVRVKAVAGSDGKELALFPDADADNVGPQAAGDRACSQWMFLNNLGPWLRSLRFS